MSIFAKQNSPVIAVNDGKIVKVGDNAQWGKYIQLQDQTGNIYTYAELGSVPTHYPVPKPVKITAAQLTKELSAPTLPSPSAPASAGAQQTTPTPSTAAATKVAKNQPITLPATTKPGRHPRHGGRRQQQHGRDADGQGAAVREPLPPPLLRRRRKAAAEERRATAPPRSRASATTSPTCCTSQRTSTRWHR